LIPATPAVGPAPVPSAGPSHAKGTAPPDWSTQSPRAAASRRLSRGTSWTGIRKVPTQLSSCQTLEERHAEVNAANAELRALKEHYATVIHELSIDQEKLKIAYEKLLVERNSLLTNVRAIADRSKKTRSRS
jgi:hypothetical protein